MTSQGIYCNCVTSSYCAFSHEVATYICLLTCMLIAMHICFLEIIFLHIGVCVCVCVCLSVCLSVCPPPRVLLTSGIIWYDIGRV